MLRLISRTSTRVESSTSFPEIEEYVAGFGGFEWNILDEHPDRILVQTKDIVELRRFDKTSSNWEKSEIRSYLNGSFKTNNFSTEEVGQILGDVFLLDRQEVENYLKTPNSRIALFEGKRRNWWLRSSGYHSHRAACVYPDGDVGDAGRNVGFGDGGVRPALWLKTSR